MSTIEADEDDFPDEYVRRIPAPAPRFPPQTLPVKERFRKANAVAAAKRQSGQSRLMTVVNPTTHLQRVQINLDDKKNTPLVLEWQPGEEAEIDVLYSVAIWMLVDTGSGPTVVGGGAPLLQRVGQAVTTHPLLTQETIDRDTREMAARDAHGRQQPKKGDFDE